MCSQAEHERQIRMRLELQDVERQQLHIKAAKKQAEKEEDDQFRQEVNTVLLWGLIFADLWFLNIK